MIRFDVCTAKTVWVDLADGARWRQELKAKTLGDFLSQEEQVFVFLDGDQAVGIANEVQALHDEVSKNCFVLGPSMFQQARDYFRGRQQTGEAVYVLDETAHVVGKVRYQPNYIDTIWQTPDGYWEYDFECDRVNEDLLNKADGYVFRSLEEYSYAIARYLGEHHPERPMYFWDPDGQWASLAALWDGMPVHFAGSWSDLPAGVKWLFIDSAMHNTESWMPEFLHLIYSSVKVMFSMIWGTHLEHLGPLFPDQKIGLVDITCPAGLVDIFKSVCSCATHLERKGFIPVIDLSTRDCCSYWEEGLNVWEELFQPWSGITVEQAKKSSHVLRASRELAWWSGTWPLNPYHAEEEPLAEEAQYPREKTKLNDKTWQYVLAHAPKVLAARLAEIASIETEGRVGAHHETPEKQRILGVKLRGTDYNRGQPGSCTLDTMVEWCRSLLMSGSYEALFLATEDADYFERFQKEFSGQLLFIEQPRVTGSIRQATEHLSHYGPKIEMARLYIADEKCLAVCDDLVANRATGAYWLAKWWRPQEKGFCKVFCDEELAPVSSKLARVFFHVVNVPQPHLAFENLDAAQPFLLRNAEPSDEAGDAEVVIEPQEHAQCIHLRLRLQETAQMRITLSSVPFRTDGLSVAQWVTFTSLRIQGREYLTQPVDVWNQQSMSCSVVMHGSVFAEIEVHWKPYDYAPQEIVELLRAKLPKGHEKQRPARPVPRWPEIPPAERNK